MKSNQKILNFEFLKKNFFFFFFKKNLIFFLKKMQKMGFFQKKNLEMSVSEIFGGAEIPRNTIKTSG